MLGAILCILTHYSRFVVKAKIKEILQVIEVLSVDKDKIEVMGEYPDLLILKTMNRPSRVKESRSRSLFSNSEVVQVHFKTIVVKNQNQVIALRGEVDAHHDSAITEFLVMAGCEIDDKFVDINLCSCASVSDIDHIYNTLVQSYRGFMIDLLGDDIRYLDNVVKGDDGGAIIPVGVPVYQFKTLDNVTYLVLEEKEELLTRRIGHLNLECNRRCCTDPGGQRLSRDELLDQVVNDLGVMVHGRLQNQHQNQFFQRERRKKKETEYINTQSRNWEDGKRIGRNYGQEVQKKKEKTFRALNPGPLLNYLVEKPKERTMEEVKFDEVDAETRKKREQARKVKIGKRSFGKVKIGEFLREEGVYREESDPDWEPTTADEISSEDYSEGEEEDLDQLNRDAMLPLAEVLKNAKISLRTLMLAELARGYQKVAAGVEDGVLSEQEAVDEMRKLRERLEKEYGITNKGKRKPHGTQHLVEAEIENVDGGSEEYPSEEGLPDNGSLTSGGNEMDRESAREKEIRAFNALKDSVDGVEKMHQARAKERETVNDNPGMIARIARAWSGDREGGEASSSDRVGDQ